MSDEENKDATAAPDDEEMMQKSAYYSHDNAIYRQRPDTASMAVDDVLHGNKFVPYKGDRVAPVMHGSKVKASKIMGLLKKGDS